MLKPMGFLPHPSTGVEFGNHPRYRIHKSYRCISHHIPLYSHDISSKSHGQMKKKLGDLSEASFNDPTDLHCSFIFKDVALGRTENLRREAKTVKNSGDGTGEERMESQILVKYM